MPVLHVAAVEPAPEVACIPGERCDQAASDRPVGGALCANGSTVDCNPKGTTRIPGSAWVDPEPPLGWRQCAGFINTEADDVVPEFLDGCLGARALRVIVRSMDGVLEEDVENRGISALERWPDWGYVGGEVKAIKKTFWGGLTFFTSTDGQDACLTVSAPSGTTFGSGFAGTAIIAGANKGEDEYRVSCGGRSLPGRKIALYRSSADRAQ